MFGRPPNPQYARERLPLEGSRAGNPQGLRDPTLDDRQIELVLRAYRERYHDLAADRRIKYVQIFKNHGERAGASYSHPHSQIIGIPIVPLRILEEGRACVRTSSSGRAS